MSASTPASKPTRPVTLKIKTPSISFSGTNITAAPLVGTPSAMSPHATTPLATPRIILKRSQPPTPAEGVPILPGPAPVSLHSQASTTAPKARIPLPTGRKRALEDDHGDEATNGPRPVLKKPKLVVKTPSHLANKGRTASIVVRQAHKAEIPPHPKGEGYDSEDDDREIDPVIEEEFILRMPPGEHCDYLRKMVDERKIGVPVREGGADFQLKWLTGVERRAVLTIKGVHFVGVLVDLPTITETMKTWDRRNFMKSADVCQMLLVFAQVSDDEEARTIPLPKMVGKDYRWPHGLTPPMHDCIHRRFRKRLSKKEIKDKEAELQRLLEEDKAALESKWELIDETRPALGRGNFGEVEDEEEEDAYGELDEEDYFGPQNGLGAAPPEIDDAALEAEFFDDMGDELEGEEGGATQEAAVAETPATQPAATPATGNTATPAAESEVSDDGDDDDEEEEEAEDEQRKGVEEDINELKKQRQTLQEQYNRTANALLRKRITENIKKVESELRLKMASIGQEWEE